MIGTAVWSSLVWGEPRLRSGGQFPRLATAIHLGRDAQP
jgi:hypothetical protein